MLCCAVLCDSPVEQHFPWAATGDKIQPLLRNNSYPPFIAADTLILAAVIEDNYPVCVIMSLPDAMKRTRRGSGKPSAAGGVDYGGGGGDSRSAAEKHQFHESIRNNPAFFFFFVLIIAVESTPVSVGFPGSQSEDLRVETT